LTAHTSEPLKVCFQFVTKGGAVMDTEPEEFPNIQAATKRAQEWMELKGRVLAFTSFEGYGVSMRTDEIEHITAMPAAKMAELFDAASTEGFPTNE
jgi:hypothetical protein